MYGRPLIVAMIITGITSTFTFFGAATAVAVPNVTTTIPTFGVSEVSATAPITATFNEAMDPASLTTTTFTVSQFTGVKAIAAGFAHTVILKNDGTVIVWGNNSMYQLAIPEAAKSGVTAIAAGESHTLALKDDGTVVAWGDNAYGQSTVTPGLTGVTAVATGFGHCLALKSNGTVSAWGLNASGQATVPTELSGVVTIAAGSFHSMALKNDGTVVAWGQNCYGQTTVPATLAGVTAIAAGWRSSTALLGNGTLVSWGEGISDKDALPGGLNDVTAIAGGGYHKIALKSDGTTFAWGYNNYGQTSVPGNLTRVVAVAAGAYHTIAMKDDGTAIAWGRNHYNQASVPANSSVTALPGAVTYNAATNTAVFTPIGSLPAPTVLTATLTSAVRSQSGGVSLATDHSWSFITGVSPSSFLLSVQILGTGNGSVHSDAPGNIACSSGICSGSFSGTVVNMTYTKDWKSLFGGWGDSCSGNSVCRPYMDKSRTVTALFVPNKQAMLDGNPNAGFATLQEAYATAQHGSRIQTHEYTFYENLKLAEDKTVTIDGGKDINDPLYQSTTGFTTLQGSLEITAGKLVPVRLIIRTAP
jgi:alpha-tubulin suppressor-like RCC1 family protein